MPNKLQPKRPDLSECAIVIDSGYSFTHVVPVIDGAVVWSSVRRRASFSNPSHARLRLMPEVLDRLDIGGKLLTNYLKELLSYRHLYMMDQTHVVNRIKESVSYVAQDFSAEIRRFEFVPSYSVACSGFPDAMPIQKRRRQNDDRLCSTRLHRPILRRDL